MNKAYLDEFKQKYIINDPLDRGAQASVYKCHKIDDPKSIYAVKIIKKEPNNIKDIVKEIEIQLSLKNHPNICKLVEYLENKQNVYLVQQYYNETNLYNFLCNNVGDIVPVPEPMAIEYMKQIVNAFKFIHGIRLKEEHENKIIIHRDLKLENIFVERIEGKVILLIGDFGISKLLKKQSTNNTQQRGSPFSMAPEVALSQKYDERADLYSMGVVFYQILFGEFPFFSNINPDPKYIADKVKEGKIDFSPNEVHISKECQQLLTKMLQYDVEKRLTFQELFNHKFFKPIEAIECDETNRLSKKSQNDNSSSLFDKINSETLNLQEMQIYAQRNEQNQQSISLKNCLQQTQIIQQKIKIQKMRLNIITFSNKPKISEKLISFIKKGTNVKTEIINGDEILVIEYVQKNQQKNQLNQSIDEHLYLSDYQFIEFNLKIAMKSNQQLNLNKETRQFWNKQDIIIMIIDFEEDYDNLKQYINEWLKIIEEKKFEKIIQIVLLVIRKKNLEQYYKKNYDDIEQLVLNQNKAQQELKNQQFDLQSVFIDSNDYKKEIKTFIDNLFQSQLERAQNNKDVLDNTFSLSRLRTSSMAQQNPNNKCC